MPEQPPGYLARRPRFFPATRGSSIGSGGIPDPGKRHDIDMYQHGHTITDAPKLPLNLLDALRDYDRDTTLKSMMGEDFSRAYLEDKQREWDAYSSHQSTWEDENTLDC